MATENVPIPVAVVVLLAGSLVGGRWRSGKGWPLAEKGWPTGHPTQHHPWATGGPRDMEALLGGL